MENANLSVIMVTWNRFDYTKKSIESLFDTLPTDKNVEIIIVDNGSEDETKEYLKYLHKAKLIDKVVLWAENRGFGKAINQGFELAGGKYIMSIDNDIELLPNWYKEVMDKFADSEIGQVGLLAYKDRVIIENGLNTAHSTVAGCWVIPRHIIDQGLRWGDKMWEEEPWQAVFFTRAIRDQGYIAGNLLEPFAVDMAEGNHKKYLDYYKKTFGWRKVDNLLAKRLIEEESQIKPVNN